MRDVREEDMVSIDLRKVHLRLSCFLCKLA